MPVLVEDAGAVRVLTLSNPTKRNALNRALLDELRAGLPAAASSDEQPIRVVILCGDPAGKCFSAGYDISAIDCSFMKWHSVIATKGSVWAMGSPRGWASRSISRSRAASRARPH